MGRNQYGFPKDSKNSGHIKISLHKKEKNEIELVVFNNGVSLPENFDIKTNDSLGLKLVAILAQDQLGGKFSLDMKKGTKFKINFNVKPV